MIREKLDEMIASALKAGKHDELDVWRSIKTAYVNYKTAKAHNEITDEVELQIIGKMVAQRKDSIEQYTNGGRIDLAQKEEKELEILASLLPKEPTINELEDATRMAISALALQKEEGYKISMKDMKDIMSMVKMEYPTANGGVISKIVREAIN